MHDTLLTLLKISLVIFMAGNLLGMGLRLDPGRALKGLRNLRFVTLSLIWGFVVGPALAWAITQVLPLAPPYAVGLVLMGMTPCAPFLSAFVSKAGGDLGSTAAYMLLISVATIVFMPLAVPVMAAGLSVDAWTIARPLLWVVVLPQALGMAVRQASPTGAKRLEPWVKRVTATATIAMTASSLAIYGDDLIGIRGSLALVAQLAFFAVVTTLPYCLGFGLRHEQKIVLSVGMASRNIGIALAPLMSVPDMDQRAIVMVVLGFPVMVAFAFMAAKWFASSATPRDRDAGSGAPRERAAK